MTGCATVYEPIATDDYYQTRDSLEASGVYFSGYPVLFTDLRVYPWRSMDYFYLGYHPYSYWRSAYYSPYFYPHYYAEFYPPYHWYFHHGYSGFYAWYDPYRYNRYRYHDPWYGSGRPRDLNPVTSSYTSGPGTNPDLRRSLDDLSRDRETMNRRYRTPRQQESSGGQRRITVAPSSGSSRSGMVILKPADQKNQPVRIPPVQPSGLSATVAPSSPSLPRVTPGSRSTAPARTSSPAYSGSSRRTSVPARPSAPRQARDRSHNRSSSSRGTTDRD